MASLAETDRVSRLPGSVAVLGRVFAVLPALATAACLDAPQVDLVGPQVVDASIAGPRSVEQPLAGAIVVEFSEPLDPASVHGGSVALLPWETIGDCRRTPLCEQGSCERGRCQASPLTAGLRRDLDAGEFFGGAALELELEPGPAGPDTRLVIRPRRPLTAHGRHSLVIGAAVRDRGGAPLSGEPTGEPTGGPQAWQRDFVTAARGSSGPQARLVSPAPGERGVATNLSFVETALFPPVPLDQPGARLELEGEDGQTVELGDPRPCPGWVPGTCLRWSPATELSPQTRYRPGGGSLRDRFGRGALPPASDAPAWFATRDGPDEGVPQAAATARLRARCLVVELEVDEPVHTQLHAGERTRELDVAGSGELGLELDGLALSEGHLLSWSLELRDRAGNATTLTGELELGSSFSAAVPRLSLTEVLANPLGPEPDAEFIELVALGSPASLAGLRLSDQPFAAIAAAWQRGEEVAADELPAVELEAGVPALLVAAGWHDQLGEDPPPPAATQRIALDASLASGGLGNAGEALSLWTVVAGAPVLVASYGNWYDTSASAHAGRSVVARPGACDLADRWRPHPLGRSSPGELP